MDEAPGADRRSAPPAADAAPPAPADIAEKKPGVMDYFQPLGHPYFDEPTMPDDESQAVTPGYVSYARPIGPGHAESVPIVKGNLVTLVAVIALSWIPVLGPFAAGIIGGWVARGWRGGLLATFLPGFIASGILWFYYEALRSLPGDMLVRQFVAAPSLWPILVTGTSIIVMLGGIVGGYAHSLRDHDTRESGRRVQVG